MNGRAWAQLHFMLLCLGIISVSPIVEIVGSVFTVGRNTKAIESNLR